MVYAIENIIIFLVNDKKRASEYNMCQSCPFVCRLLYDENFGGVSSMSKDHFKTINGYSNLFFGWGGEDDDLFNRCV